MFISLINETLLLNKMKRIPTQEFGIPNIYREMQEHSLFSTLYLTLTLLLKESNVCPTILSGTHFQV